MLELDDTRRTKRCAIRIRPPIVAATYFLAAFLLDRVVDNPRIIDQSYRLIGVAIFIIGLTIGVWSILVFRTMDTTHEPFGRPTALAMRGPYQFSRNPMYFSVALSLLGAAVYTGRALFFLVPVAFVLTVNASHIPREEKLLQKIFGSSFEDYKQRVRRWL